MYFIENISTATSSLHHMFSKCSVRSPRAPQEKPRGSASCSFTYVFFLEIYCGAPQIMVNVFMAP